MTAAGSSVPFESARCSYRWPFPAARADMAAFAMEPAPAGELYRPPAPLLRRRAPSALLGRAAPRPVRRLGACGAVGRRQAPQRRPPPGQGCAARPPGAARAPPARPRGPGLVSCSRQGGVRAPPARSERWECAPQGARSSAGGRKGAWGQTERGCAGAPRYTIGPGAPRAPRRAAGCDEPCCSGGSPPCSAGVCSPRWAAGPGPGRRVQPGPPGFCVRNAFQTTPNLKLPVKPEIQP